MLARFFPRAPGTPGLRRGRGGRVEACRHLMGSALLILVVFVVLCAAVLAGMVRVNAALSLARGHWRASFDQLRGELQKFHESTRGILEPARVLLRQERVVCEEVRVGLEDAVQSLERVAANPADAVQMGALFGAQNRLLQKLEAMRRIALPHAEWKGGRNFLALLKQLAEVAKGLEESRSAYNEATRAFNQSRSGFPVFLLAGFLGFQRAAPLEEKEVAPTVPSVPRSEPQAPEQVKPQEEQSQNSGAPRVFYG